ncbi:hypothetical protein [Hyphomicrobium sp.]|uniref:hypothetical protein n=1 Tax=Hyphomicrobium sp. TaxID=82 RepID=UPI003F6F2543
MPNDFASTPVSATIEQLRYWAPTIKDVARVIESDGPGDGWTLSIVPSVVTACPVAITLQPSGRFDILIAGETYTDRALGSLDQIVALLERITDGGVVQRRWVSCATGIETGVETMVPLGTGLVWRNGPEPDEESERRDRHFLPYRRI